YADPSISLLDTSPSSATHETFTEEEMHEALAKVGLLDKITNDVGGLDAKLEPESTLSHGERQLFCLARALLKKERSRLLVLDEFTSSVDLETDAKMQKVMREAFEKTTVIAVVHRLDTVMDFDRIVVMDQGVMAE